MYEYMLYWRRNDWVNKETELKYYLSQPIDPVMCLCGGGPVSPVSLLVFGQLIV